MTSTSCPFCTLPASDIVLENELAIAFYDRFPVSSGHLLIVAKRHIAGYFEATEAERKAIHELLEQGKALLDEKYQPDGYNIGINIGEEAGQTIFHLHIHLIPRFKGDHPNPRGGVRGVIPGKQDY